MIIVYKFTKLLVFMHLSIDSELFMIICFTRP